MKNNLKIYLCFLLAFLSFQEKKIESPFEVLGPWGQDIDVRDLNWIDNENLIFLEESSSPPFEEKAKFINININGITSSTNPLGRILKTNNKKILWKKKTMSGPTVIWYGEAGKEKIIAESQTDIKKEEVSWIHSGKLWIRGWVNDETYLLDKDFKPSKSINENIYYLEREKIKKTNEENKTETIYENKENNVQISNFTTDTKGNMLILETNGESSRILILEKEKEKETILDWTKEYTIGIYGGESVGWRMNPKDPTSRKQQFCTFENTNQKKCFSPKENHFMQVYQWSLAENIWINSFIDVKTNKINLIKWDSINDKFETIARMDKLKNLSISPDKRKIAVVSTTHKQHWNWDIFVLNLE